MHKELSFSSKNSTPYRRNQGFQGKGSRESRHGELLATPHGTYTHPRKTGCFSTLSEVLLSLFSLIESNASFKALFPGSLPLTPQALPQPPLSLQGTPFPHYSPGHTAPPLRQHCLAPRPRHSPAVQPAGACTQ